MAVAYADRVWFSTSSTGTGTSIGIGSALSGGYQTPSSAGLASGSNVCYAIADGNNFEIQLYQAYASGPGSGSFARGTPASSSNSGSQISLSGSASVMVVLPAAQICTQKIPTATFSANGSYAPMPAAPATLHSLNLQNTTTNAVLVSVGISSGGTQVISQASVGPTAVVVVPSGGLLNASWSSAQTLYVSSTAWNSATLNVTGWFVA